MPPGITATLPSRRIFLSSRCQSCIRLRLHLSHLGTSLIMFGTSISGHLFHCGRDFPEMNIRALKQPEPRENIEPPTSNTERRSERGFAMSFDVRRWMFDVGCSSGSWGGNTSKNLT